MFNNQTELTPEQLAIKLGVSVMTVSRWRARGCPYTETKQNALGKEGSRPRYNLEQVKAWINEQRKEKGEQA